MKVAPRWMVEPTGGNAVVGESLAIHCKAFGVPTPRITWMKAPGK